MISLYTSRKRVVKTDASKFSPRVPCFLGEPPVLPTGGSPSETEKERDGLSIDLSSYTTPSTANKMASTNTPKVR